MREIKRATVLGCSNSSHIDTNCQILLWRRPIALFSFFRLGAWSSLFFQIVTDGFSGSDPIPTELDSFNLTTLKKSAHEACGETTNL